MAMPQAVESVEAVIISGSRKGEIVRLPDIFSGELVTEDVEALNVSLNDLIAAMDRLSTEVRATVSSLRAQEENI